MEGETLGDRRSDAQVLVDTLGDTLPEVEANTPGDTRAIRWHWSTVCADTLAEVEAETLGNTCGAEQPPVNAVAASRAE